MCGMVPIQSSYGQWLSWVAVPEVIRGQIFPWGVLATTTLMEGRARVEGAILMREEEREVGGEVGRKGSDDESIETPAIFREVGPLIPFFFFWLHCKS